MILIRCAHERVVVGYLGSVLLLLLPSLPMLFSCGGVIVVIEREREKTQVIQSIWIQHAYTFIGLPSRMHYIRNIHRHHHNNQQQQQYRTIYKYTGKHSLVQY